MINRQKTLEILKRYPKLYFWVYSIRYRWEIFWAKQLVIVTTPGHVGSSTTFKSLKTGNWETSTKIYDIHSLKERYNNSSEVSSISARHVLQEVLREKLGKNRLGHKKLILVTLVRDPIARALSGKFQDPKVFLKEVDAVNLKAEEFEEAFLKVKEEMLQSGYLLGTVNWQLSFYQDELRSFWNLDLNHELSNIEAGFAIAKKDNMTLFVFGLEYLNRQLPAKVKKYLGIDIQLLKANMSAQRQRGDEQFYSYCKRHIKLDKELIDKLYQNRVLEQIYPESKIQQFKKSWTAQ